MARTNKRRTRSTVSVRPIDKTSAEKLYERALALAKRGRKRHAKQVIPLLEDATNAGHAMAAHALATWYFCGIGVRRNFAVAATLEKKAARAGIIDAIRNLAFAFESGKGVRKDEKKALRLYRRAAAIGNPGATYEVGRCIYYGIGAQRNERLGQKWVQKAEQMGYVAKRNRD